MAKLIGRKFNLYFNDVHDGLWRVVDVYYALSDSCWCLEYIPDSAGRKGKNNVEWGEVEWFLKRYKGTPPGIEEGWEVVWEGAQVK